MSIKKTWAGTEPGQGIRVRAQLVKWWTETELDLRCLPRIDHLPDNEPEFVIVMDSLVGYVGPGRVSQEVEQRIRSYASIERQVPGSYPYHRVLMPGLFEASCFYTALEVLTETSGVLTIVPR